MITKEQRAAEIKADFQAFLAKWDLEMEVVTSDTGWSGTSVDGVEFSWNGVYDENHDTVVEYGSVNVGNWCSKDNV